MRKQAITEARAEHIARSHACVTCGEYSYKRLVVRPASKAARAELKVAWEVQKVCGVCETAQEMGIDNEGEIVYVG